MTIDYLEDLKMNFNNMRVSSVEKRMGVTKKGFAMLKKFRKTETIL